MASEHYDYDWMVIGSGFGGSISALRLAEKGYKVAVAERGRRWTEATLPKSAWRLPSFHWLPSLGLRGVMRLLVFKDLFVVSGSGVGGGSLIYAGTLYRPPEGYFKAHRWAGRDDWAQALAPHYDTAERMLGVARVPFDSDGARALREYGQAIGRAEHFEPTPCGIFFGEPGKTVPDPYFGGEGPPRTGCTRCGACMVGCRDGGKNSLDKNYLWFAEKRGAQILPEHRVTDIKPLGGPDGADGYLVTTERPGAWFNRRRREFRVRGVVLAAGSAESTRLLLKCRATGSLPGLSARIGTQVRTNSESILAVKLPASSPLQLWNTVAHCASLFVSEDTHVALCTYGKAGDGMSSFFTLLVGPGSGWTRPLKLLGQAILHPIKFLGTLWPVGWSKRTAILLVMQNLDNGITLVARRGLLGGFRMGSAQDIAKPAPTFIQAATDVAKWWATRFGGTAQTALPEAIANVPSTSHMLGGAVIAADAAQGVVDHRNRAFGYRNLLVCDGSALPANLGVNPSLTIAAVTEHAMSHVPAAAAKG